MMGAGSAGPGEDRVVLLMRHAEAAPVPGRGDQALFSVGDTPLSARGRDQAAAMAPVVQGYPVEAVYASPARRSQETARIVARGSGLDVTLDPDLRELPFATPGASYKQVLERILALADQLRTEDDPVLPGGEHYRAALTRFSQAIHRVRRDHPCALVVAHGAINRAFLAPHAGLEPHELYELDQGHACLNVLRWPAGATDGTGPRLDVVDRRP